MDFSTIKTASKKVIENNVDILTSEITPQKVRGNNLDLRQKKVCGNHVGFWTIEITSKKVRGNDMEIGFRLSSLTYSSVYGPTLLLFLVFGAKGKWECVSRNPFLAI